LINYEKLNQDTPKLTALDRRYFNTTKNYTLAILNAFDKVQYYVQERDENDNYVVDKLYTVPITFGNYEKSVVLEDINESDIRAGNVNIVPRLVLSFDGMTKVPERTTQKFQKFTKRIKIGEIANYNNLIDVTKYDPDKTVLDLSYNSIPYDYNFTLLLQARGLSSATQITETILAFFNPSYQLNIKEFPLFPGYTTTQLLLNGDPEFEIVDEFEDTQVNIINVTFSLTLRGNIYRNLSYQAPIEVVSMFVHVWDNWNYQESKLSSYFKFDVDSNNTHKIYKETKRVYNGTMKYDENVTLPEEEMAELRPDYDPPEIITEFDIENTGKENNE